METNTMFQMPSSSVVIQQHVPVSKLLKIEEVFAVTS